MTDTVERTRTRLAEVRDLRISFDDHEVVKGVSFGIDAGECLAIVGESGSGKSVTARTLIGLTGDRAHIEADTVTFDGRSLLGLDDRQWRRIRGRDIGFVLQDALVSLDQLRTVGGEIGEAISTHSATRSGNGFWSRAGLVQRAVREERVVELLDLVGVPESRVRARQRPHELSGGLRQRALIASAIANDPKLVIADEPTTALDATVQAQILDVLREAKERGNAVILISHDLAVVARLADRVAVMRDGEIVESGTTAQVLSRPEHDYTRRLLDSVPSRASKGTLLTSGAQVSGTPDDRSDRPLAIRARDLVKSYTGPDGSERPAVRGVGFDLEAGKTLGIVGESGSGKTTTARMVLGLTTPDSGSIELNGHAWSTLSDAQRRRSRDQISVIYQDPLSSFDPRWNVQRILRDSLRPSGVRGVEADRRVSELLDQVGLSDAYRLRHPLQLSGGQRQRVAIARALAPEPSVIVCDEPVSALDVSIQARVLDLLATLQAETGVALLFISHDLGVIHHVSDDILVMKDGETVEHGPADSVFGNPTHPYTAELLAAVPTIEANLVGA
ncbi:dipeptide ABC transporter ATP-binding protein [Gordonia soli]|uniref:Putative peptide ABC transporter ATP-binding protein n=1 Tax=Gordonia soli NBRC 108243 TaxID=1223545 RepID=M0QI81_9ACTN|nr:ABC transporter ATP-binding protein [Gordonia soli]GAC67137.1 putative peptide ABC transporter ATP-binding protein [Gordonia soli NBRC 108243]